MQIRQQFQKKISNRHQRRYTRMRFGIDTCELPTGRSARTGRNDLMLQELQKMIATVLSKVLSRFARDQRGASMLEYGLLVGLVAIAAIVAITAMGNALETMFNDAANELP